MKYINKELNLKRLFICFLIGMPLICFFYNHVNFKISMNDFFIGHPVSINSNRAVQKYLPYLFSFVVLFLYYFKFEVLLKDIYCFLYTKAETFNKIKVIKIPFLIKALIMVVFVIMLCPDGKGLGIHEDLYHFGEVLVANWLADENSYKLYKDFYPVHGLCDVLPGWIGAHIFHDTNASGVVYGMWAADVLQLFIYSFFAFMTLPFCTALVSVAIVKPYFEFQIAAPCLMILLFLITNKKLKANFPLFTFLLCLLSYVIYASTPTFGAPFVLAMIIPYVYRLIIYWKSATKKQKITYCSLFVILNAIVLFIFRDFYFPSFAYVLMNYKANLLTFADVAPLDMHVFLRTSQYLFTPVFLIFLFFELSKKQNKNIDKVILLATAVAFPFFVSTYSLGGGNGGGLFSRSFTISFVYLTAVIPLLIDKEKNKFFYTSYMSILIIISCFMFYKSSKSAFATYKYSSPAKHFNTPYRNGSETFSDENYKIITEVDTLIKKIADNKDYTFFDMTCNNALYFYLNKKPLLPYLGMINIIDPREDYISAKKTGENLPDIVLGKVYSSNLSCFGMPIGLRVNNIYKTILLSNKYEVVDENKITLLKKVENHTFTPKEIDILQDAFNCYDLNQLPDSWGNSFKKLKKYLEPLPIKYNIAMIKDKTYYEIDFDKPVEGKNLNLVRLKTDKSNVNFKLKINGIELNIVSHEKNKLIPLDMNPVVLLNNTDKIEIEFDRKVKIKEIQFFKRNFVSDKNKEPT